MKLAFIGLGAIGLPMARRLAQHPALELSIYDTRREVLEAEAGLGRVGASIADAVKGAEAIFSVLPADPQVASVGAELAAAVSAGQVYVDFSTVAPSTIDAVARQLETAGVGVLGAALTRSVAAAEDGTLSIFVGGEPELVERVRPALDQMATETRQVATRGGAKALKILNNMIVSSTDLVVCEALLLGARHGVEPQELTDALRAGGGDSWALQNHIVKHLLTDDLAPGRFSTRYMGKDAALAARLASESGQPAWYAALVTASYRGTEALGFGDHYHPVVMRWLEHAAGTGRATPRSDVAVVAGADPAAALRALSNGVVAQQAMITLNSLLLIAEQGIEVSEALGHFASGSADNALIQALQASEASPLVEATLGATLEELVAVCALASAAEVPAFSYEIGKHVALNLVSRHGPGATIREISHLTVA